MPLVPALALATLLACGDQDEGPSTEGTHPGECADGADNDADSLYDCDDPDCADAPDCAPGDGGADGGSADGGGADGGGADGGADGGSEDVDCNQVSVRGVLDGEEIELGSAAWYAIGDRNIFYAIIEPDACDHASILGTGGPGDVLAEGIFFDPAEGDYAGPFTVGFPDDKMWLDFKINYGIDRSFRATGGDGVASLGTPGGPLVIDSVAIAGPDGETLQGNLTACWCPGLEGYLPE